MFCWFCNISYRLDEKFPWFQWRFFIKIREREREIVLNRKCNYLNIEKFLCKALWKVAFYSSVLTIYMHTYRTAQKQALYHLLTGEWFGNFSVILSPQIRALYTTFKKEWLLQTYWIGSENTGFLFSYQNKAQEIRFAQNIK